MKRGIEHSTNLQVLLFAPFLVIFIDGIFDNSNYCGPECAPADSVVFSNYNHKQAGLINLYLKLNVN